MDLQAILDATDSSDEVEAVASYRYPDVESQAMDLEQILREDDLDDDDDEEIDPAAVGYSLEPPSTLRLWEGHNVQAAHKRLMQWRADNNNNAAVSSSREYLSVSHHNPDDWAVLQAILNEDDNDEEHNDDDEDWLDMTQNNRSLLSPPDKFDGRIFVSSNEINEDLEDCSTLLTLSTVSSPHHRSTMNQSGSVTIHVNRADDVPEVVEPLLADEAALMPAPDGKRTLSVTRLITSTTGRSGVGSIGRGGKSETDEELISQRALAHAQAYERKLLRSGHREIVSPLMVKRRLKPKIEIGSKNKKRRHQGTPNLIASSSTSSSPKFGFSGSVENRPMAGVSDSMSRHSKSSAKVYCGLPTSLAFNSKFIAIGTQLGIILVYDLFEVLRQRLGASGYDDNNVNAKKAGSITSLDISFNGEAVVAGYSSGILVLWDTIRGIVLRAVHDSHPSPISSVRFLSELKMVTVDAGGLVNKLTFTKNILWTNYNLETDCLLDGTAGQILAMDILPPYGSIKPIIRPDVLSRVLRSLTLIALSSERSSFAVAVEPSVSVLHRWAKPRSDRIYPSSGSQDETRAQIFLPCLSWGWALVSGAGNIAMPMLARAWGCCLQLLVASFPTFDEADAMVDGEKVHWPAFGLHDEVDASAPIVALEWLNERTLAYLTVTNEFTLVDTVMMTMLERLDFSGFHPVYADFLLSRNGRPQNPAEGETQPRCTTFQNSLRCSDDRILILCQEEVRCISIVGVRSRISSLEEDGEWLEALALALDHYENTVVSQEDRKRDPSGKKDLSRHPEFSTAKSEDEEWIAKLLIRYLNLAVENAPEPVNEKLSPYSVGATRNGLAYSHFQMLAGVCVEFCVVTRRLDLLFGPIFRRFQNSGYISVFLDVLEPYVLNDKLSYIGPEVMAFFVAHCRATNGIQTVERCLLHMDCTIMDFDSILLLLRNNEMYSALFYVFNSGLDDFITPLEIMLERVFDDADIGGAVAQRNETGAPMNDFQKYGYKAVLYLQTCFKGETFPQESPLLPEEKRSSVKLELLAFLMKEHFELSPLVKRTSDRSRVVGVRALRFPYLRVLLLLDPRRMLETISLALDTDNMISLSQEDVHISESEWTAAGAMNRKKTVSRQDIAAVMELIIINDDTNASSNSPALQSQGTINAFLDFLAKYIITGSIQVKEQVGFMVLTRLSYQFASAPDAEARHHAQKQVMDVLSALPRDSYDPDKVLELINNSGMHRAALFLHQQVASSWHESSSDDIALRCRHFQAAIDCFLEDEDHLFRKEVFSYVKKECSGVEGGEVSSEPGVRPETLRDALISKLSSLVKLDALMTARLVAELFVDDMDHVVDSLEKSDGGESLFLFLQPIISGDLLQADPVAGSVINLTMEHHHRYLAIMAKLHPETVYEYLSTHDNYRPEDCLELCQQYDIADASAYLLERMGNVSSALQLILQTLESRMMALKRTIRGMGVESHRGHYSSKHGRFPEALVPSKQEKEVKGVKRILIVSLDICERNSGTFTSRSEHGSQLWFNVLDRLINAKGFLRLTKEQPEHARIMSSVQSDLLRLTMQRMVSSVPLTDLVRKVTSDHSDSRLGDLREMLDSLLGTYGFELRLFAGASSIFHNDVRAMQGEHRNLQLKGTPIYTLTMPHSKSVGSSASAKPIVQTTDLRGRVLCLDSPGKAHVVDEKQRPYSEQVENGLTQKLARLRTKRGGGGEFPSTSRNASNLPMLTVTETMFLHHETEPVVYSPRPVGLLGTAEHRGRLVTFQIEEDS